MTYFLTHRSRWLALVFTGWLALSPGAVAQPGPAADAVEEAYPEEGLKAYEEYGGYEERQPLPEVRPRAFDRAHWRSLTEDLRYESTPGAETKADRSTGDRRDRRPDGPGKAPGRSPGGGLGALAFPVKVLGIVLGVVALVFLLLQIFGGGAALFRPARRLRGGAVHIDLEDIEANLEQTELETYIQRAVREGRYRLAVRLYYLDILKALSARGVLRWKRDKTNGEYLRALRGHPLHPDFAAATRTFERVWYGRAELSAATFRSLEPGLQSLTRAAGAATPVA